MFFFLCTLIVLCVCVDPFPLSACNVTANDPSSSTAHANAVAIKQCVNAHHSVLVDDVYVSFNISLANMTHVHLVFAPDSRIVAAADYKTWPLVAAATQGDKPRYADLLSCDGCVDFSLTSQDVTRPGRVDGQGFDWWLRQWLGLNKGYRPALLSTRQTAGILIVGVEFWNSPQYHVHLVDSRDGWVENVTIYVNTSAQEYLYRRAGTWDHKLRLPIFLELNTDGIDPSGENFTITNVNIENFDDAVAVKPNNGQSTMSSCTNNVLVDGAVVKYSVGMTIGSVPANNHTNCIRDVTFRNVRMDKPAKAIYIKSDPPRTTGHGIIANITYENFDITNTLWFTVFIGPQQQHQPHGVNTGCSFLFPVEGKCPANPRVTIDYVTLRNISSSGTDLPYAGLIHRTAETPSTNFVFEDVSVTGLVPAEDNWWCDNAEVHTARISPPIKCVTRPDSGPSAAG